MDSLCRLCATRSSPQTSIFSIKSGRLVLDMVTTICPVKIEVNDQYSKFICLECLEIVIKAIELREMSVQSDLSFRSSSLPEEILIKKEKDPISSILYVEPEMNDGSDEDLVNYEPDVKKMKGEYVCELCGRDFITKTHLTIHMRSVHSDKKPPVRIFEKARCELCGFVVSHKNNLGRHMKRLHDKNSPFGCDKCTCRFLTQARLDIHIIKEHTFKSDADETLQCEFCDLKFTIQQNLQRHYQRRHWSELKHECDVCKKRFFDPQHLYRHCLKVHEDGDEKLKNIPGDDICQFCNQNFNGSKYRFERHMIVMHEDEQKEVLECDKCCKKFIFKSSMKFHLNNHLKRMKEENLPFKCGHCPRRFNDEEKLKSHFDSQHKPNNFICYICGKTFKGGRHGFEIHMKKHNNIKDFLCQQCPLKFVTPRDLNRHLTTHSDARPFPCTECSMRFKSKDVLRKHKKIHAKKREKLNSQNQFSF